jgi:hypothetical protein
MECGGCDDASSFVFYWLYKGAFLGRKYETGFNSLERFDI